MLAQLRSVDAVPSCVQFEDPIPEAAAQDSLLICSSTYRGVVSRTHPPVYVYSNLCWRQVLHEHSLLLQALLLLGFMLNFDSVRDHEWV
jgi:hypothetical protein